MGECVVSNPRTLVLLYVIHYLFNVGRCFGTPRFVVPGSTPEKPDSHPFSGFHVSWGSVQALKQQLHAVCARFGRLFTNLWVQTGLERYSVAEAISSEIWCSSGRCEELINRWPFTAFRSRLTSEVQEHRCHAQGQLRLLLSFPAMQ